MSYQSVRQQLLQIASQPLPKTTIDYQNYLKDRIAAAGAAAGGILEEDSIMYDSEDWIDAGPTLYERIKARVVIFIYHTIPNYTAGAH